MEDVKTEKETNILFLVSDYVNASETEINKKQISLESTALRFQTKTNLQ